MSNSFKFSVLQYKHSLALGEALNVGVLFYFPRAEKLYFVADSSNRVKSIYKNIDGKTFHQLIKGIEDKISQQDHLFHQSELRDSLKKSIHNLVLPEDSTSFQFSDPKTAVNIFETDEKAVKEYTKLLLPSIETDHTHAVKHSETFLVRTYTELVLRKERTLKEKLKLNQTIETKELRLKFDIAWRNGSLKLVKPISFDLADEQTIQSKSAQFFGYLTLLRDYANKENCRFDLLISRPQDQNLLKAYDKAIEILNEANTPKKIITEDKLEAYSQETVDELLSH